MKDSKLLADVRLTIGVPLIGGHLHYIPPASSSLGLVGEFHTNAQRFDTEHLLRIRWLNAEHGKVPLPASSASRFARTERRGSLSKPPRRTSLAPPLSKNVMSWFSCFLPKGQVRR